MKTTKYNVLIYPRAEQDLLEIKEYFELKLKTSPNSLFEKLLLIIDILETNPLIYPLVHDPFLKGIGYRMVPIDNYLLFYVIKKDDVQIHRFLYGKRDYLKIL